MENREIPNGWIETTLGEVAEIASGGTPSTKEEAFWGNDISWITPKDLSGYTKRYINKGENNITQLGLEKSSAKLLPKNTVLFSSRAPIGYVAIAESKLTTNQGFKNLICNEKISNFLFMFYWLKNNVNYIEQLASGSTFKEISSSGMKQVKLTIPPLPEQKAIADVLSSLDEKIELLEEENKTLETLAQTIFTEWFVNFNFPGRMGEQCSESGTTSPGATGEMEDSELGEIPKGWRVEGIRNYVEHKRINIKPFEEPSKEFVHFSLPAFDNGKKADIAMGGEISSNKYLVVDNCFLVSKLNPSTPRVWTILKALENYICSTEFQVIKPLSIDYFGFIYGALTSDKMIRELSGRAHGTSSSHQRVNPADILDVSLIIPNNEIMAMFSQIMNQFLEKIDCNLIQIQTLKSTRDTLLPKLMSGEIRVEGFGE